VSGQARAQVLRIAAAAAAVGLLVIVLWQAGVLFRPAGEEVRTPEGQTVRIQPANTSIDTPNADGRTVGLRVGDLAPDFEFSDLDGRRVRLSDYRGKVVFLNFWATWCGPCRVEMPDMMTVLEKYEDQGLVIIAINNGEAYGPAIRFIDNLELRFTAIGMDPTQEVVRRYQVFGMPTSYFIDAEGVVTRVHASQLSLRVMESAVQDAFDGVARD
jgi:peroxiredoxin